MPTTPRSFCYVLTDPTAGRYAAMTAISAAATRRLHPRETINVVADAATARRLRASNHALLAYVDAVRPIETPYLDAKLQSRYLKTTLRRHVAGDLVFLDADAVPMRRLDRLFDFDGDFCAALDGNAPTPAESLEPKHRAELERMGWPVPSMYVNSGVFLARDVPRVHALFDQWHARWLQYVAAGRHQDQYALNSVLATCGGARVSILPAAYNAQIAAREDAIRNASIVHFYLSFGGLDETVFADLVEQTVRTGAVGEPALGRFLRSWNPWTTTDSMRRYYWTGHPILAAGVAFRKALAKIARGRKPTSSV